MVQDHASTEEESPPTEMFIPILSSLGWERVQAMFREAEIPFSAGYADGEGQGSEYWIIVPEERCSEAVDRLQDAGIESGLATPIGDSVPGHQYPETMKIFLRYSLIGGVFILLVIGLKVLLDSL